MNQPADSTSVLPLIPPAHAVYDRVSELERQLRRHRRLLRLAQENEEAERAARAVQRKAVAAHG